MIKVEKIETYGWEAAIRGMRNPMNSWDKSDSYYGCEDIRCYDCQFIDRCTTKFPYAHYEIGVNDLALMKKLAHAGSDHRKFLRQIVVSMDITAPLYWWKEFDTYKVGTVANSCSTMHKIHAKEFTLDDFSHDHLGYHGDPNDVSFSVHCANSNSDDDLVDYFDDESVLELVIEALNHCRDLYIKAKDKRFWYKMIQLLPSSYNQLRTVTLNYEVLLNMYNARKDHKLDEWRELCDIIEDLPYFKEVCIE